MATVRETVIGLATSGAHDLTINRLFIVFCSVARTNYKYSAVKVPGNEGNTLLGRPDGEIVTVDCASLADALVELINENFDDKAQRVQVSEADAFATQERSRCFDTAIVGNIRLPGGTFGQTGRCVFSQHYFVETGAQTRMYLDPCMFGTYAKQQDAVSWKFNGGVIKGQQIVKFVQEEPSLVLIRTPLTAGAPPPGFNSSFIIFKKTDFKTDQLRAMEGRVAATQKYRWNDQTYQDNAAGALAQINKVLKDQAGINTPWVIA